MSARNAARVLSSNRAFAVFATRRAEARSTWRRCVLVGRLQPALRAVGADEVHATPHPCGVDDIAGGVLPQGKSFLRVGHSNTAQVSHFWQAILPFFRKATAPFVQRRVLNENPGLEQRSPELP
jgi:hypothetical protein